MIEQIGDVCDEWDYQAGRCASQVPVFHKQGTSSCHFTTKMAIDADGAPKGYFPGEYKPSNLHDCFDWMNNLNPADVHGTQGQGGAVGPAPGFVISGTALMDRRFPENDARRYVDASTIPYVVLTGSDFPVPAGLALSKGCLAFVADVRTGIYSGAIYADVGRAVGEASLALALMVGINPFSRRYFPKVGGGTAEKRIFHLVFPTDVVPPPWDVAAIQAKAAAAFAAWGGEPALRQLFPALPPMTGPRPVVIRPPDQRLALPPDEDEAPRGFKGGDVPKSALPGYED
ncbi:hypothetical protein ACVIGB_005216 [Bradyrhizobium sp. USDA 4341]